MKKTLYILLVLAGMVMTTLSVSASNPVSTSASSPGTPSKFIIEGTIDLNIPDSCYNIYLRDIDGTISENDLVATVKVKDKKFRFETAISVMKQGRIRAMMPDGTLCSSWINLYFIPGFTVYMTIHDGYYDIHNENQYNFMVNAWQNEVPVAALLARLGISQDTSGKNKSSELKTALKYYDELISDFQNQINFLYQRVGSSPSRANAIDKLLNRIEVINAKVEKLIDKYVSEMEPPSF